MGKIGRLGRPRPSDADLARATCTFAYRDVIGPSDVVGMAGVARYSDFGPRSVRDLMSSLGAAACQTIW